MKIPVISDAVKYSKLAWDLRSFLRNTITLEQSKQVLSTRLQNRGNNFLNIVHKGIYGNPKSPYLELLNWAGCEFGDIESMVNKDGIEAALQQLLSQGVYLSWEEFKGKKDVLRGGSCFRFEEKDFDNPFLDSYYYVRSSGSRSAGTRTAIDLRFILDVSYYRPLRYVVNGVWEFPAGIWLAGLPSEAGISNLLRYQIMGKPLAKWFSPVTESQTQSSLRDRLAMKYIIYGSRLWGARLVKPQYVSVSQAVEVAEWMAATKREFGGCSLTCFTSLAFKVCQAAMENALDIKGTHFFVGGEPLTEAKRRQIEASGASVTPGYSITEVGTIGLGCPKICATDDVHLFSDSIALIQRQRKVEHTDIYVDAFLFTSLLASSPKILINVESDDYGVVETRSCGCLFEELGFKKHVYNIRSFSKLTGGGMTIIGSDFVRILEDVLPSKYGGVATDYQLIEEEDSQGQTHLSLIISPTVGAVAENEVIETVLRELREGAHGGKLAAGFWSQVNTLQVKRMNPISRSGKIMTLHLLKKP